MEYIKTKKIIHINKNNSWFQYEYNMNIYQGCNHGCIYCDSRNDFYGITDFDCIKIKQNALKIIRDNLRMLPKKGIICTGAMSDPYNPLEKELNLTRFSLELINAFNQGVGIITKSDLITRDIDMLKDIQKHSPILLNMTLTTTNDELAKIIEPNAPLPSARLKAIKALSDAGLYVGVILMPVLPFIEDDLESVKKLLEDTITHGAKFIYPRVGMTLRGNQKEYYYKKLDEHFPNLKDRYIETYQDKVYCNSLNTRALMKLLRTKCNQHNVLYRMEDIIKDSRKNYQMNQHLFIK